MRFAHPTPLAAPLLAVLALSACRPRVDPAAEEEALRAISSTWQAMDRTRDANGVAALFAEDAAVYWEARPPAVGREAIRTHMATAYAENPTAEGSWSPDLYRVAASGDLAVEEGSWEGGGDAGRYLTVYRKAAGVWEIVTDVSLATAPDGGAPAWAREWLARWYEVFNARDAATLAAMYAPDAVVGEARGRRAIASRFESGWAGDDLRCSGSFDGFEIRGPIATGWGRDTCFGSGPDGQDVVERAPWLAVYERQVDGSWLCIRDSGASAE